MTTCGRVLNMNWASKISDESILNHFQNKAVNRPFSYSENECGSNDISLQLVEFFECVQLRSKL